MHHSRASAAWRPTRAGGRSTPTIPYRFGTLVLALALDLAFGEPPARLHPVVWIGKAIDVAGTWRPSGRAGRLAHGLVHVALLAGASAAFGSAIDRRLRRVPTLLAAVAEAAILKTTLSLRGLVEASRAVAADLHRGDVQAARLQVRALVSRDAQALGPALLTSAVVESVAENAADSVLAPLLYYVVGGLPAALLYRVVNTMDAMIGYHGEHEYSGKAAARLDDLLNFLPARLAAGLFIVAATLTGGDAAGALGTLVRDAGRTESPNAGWPMSAMAGALGVRLEKRGAYQLGAPLPLPDIAAIDHAVQVLLVATGLSLPPLLALARWRRGRRLAAIG